MRHLFWSRKKRSSGSKLYESNIYYYVLNGILFTIVTNLYKPFAQKFIFRLEGTESHVSLFNSLPGLVAVFAIIPGIIWVSRSADRRRTTSLFFLMSRLFILSFALVPFLPEAYRPIVFVLLAALMNFPEAVSTTALQSFSADAFAEKDRAFAISAKNKYSALINFITLLVLGQLMKGFGTTQGQAIQVYQLFYVAAFALGILEIITFRKIKEEKSGQSPRIDIRAALPEVFRNKVFMRFLACSFLFHFGWQMGWPLFGIYQIKYLGADEAWLTIGGVTSGIAMFVSSGFWERLISRKGNCFAIALATTGMAITPILFALSPNLYILTVAGIIMGFFTSGTLTSILSSLLEAAPEHNRLAYVAVHATMTNVTLFVAPLIGDLALAGTNIYIALALCAAARFSGSLAFTWRDRCSRGINKQIGKSI